jgi:peroxiredoxin
VRNWKRSAGVFLVLAVMLAACAGSGGSSPAGVNEGNQARDFSLETLDGSRVSLEDYRGKVVLVNFWATWCPPCRDEVPDIETTYRERRDEGFVVLGVNVEEPRGAVEPFVAEFDMTYPVLLDESGQVLKMYRAIGLPMSVVVDQEGVIRARHVGFLTAAELERYLADLLP